MTKAKVSKRTLTIVIYYYDDNEEYKLFMTKTNGPLNGLIRFFKKVKDNPLIYHHEWRKLNINGTQ